MNPRNTAYSCYMCTQDSCRARRDPNEDCGCGCHGDRPTSFTIDLVREPRSPSDVFKDPPKFSEDKMEKLHLAEELRKVAFAAKNQLHLKDVESANTFLVEFDEEMAKAASRGEFELHLDLYGNELYKKYLKQSGAVQKLIQASFSSRGFKIGSSPNTNTMIIVWAE